MKKIQCRIETLKAFETRRVLNSLEKKSQLFIAKTVLNWLKIQNMSWYKIPRQVSNFQID